MRSIVNRSGIGSMPGISSQTVILIEGDADELVPKAKLPAGMYGFVIMVPPGEGGERLLDMLWRITMAFAARPSILSSRTLVRKMIEAVWSKESREPKPVRRPARNNRMADTVTGAESVPDPRGSRKAQLKRKG